MKDWFLLFCTTVECAGRITDGVVKYSRQSIVRKRNELDRKRSGTCVPLLFINNDQ